MKYNKRIISNLFLLIIILLSLYDLLLLIQVVIDFLMTFMHFMFCLITLLYPTGKSMSPGR